MAGPAKNNQDRCQHEWDKGRANCQAHKGRQKLVGTKLHHRFMKRQVGGARGRGATPARKKKDQERQFSGVGRGIRREKRGRVQDPTPTKKHLGAAGRDHERGGGEGCIH